LAAIASLRDNLLDLQQRREFASAADALSAAIELPTQKERSRAEHSLSQSKGTILSVDGNVTRGCDEKPHSLPSWCGIQAD